MNTMTGSFGSSRGSRRGPDVHVEAVFAGRLLAEVVVDVVRSQHLDALGHLAIGVVDALPRDRAAPLSSAGPRTGGLANGIAQPRPDAGVEHLAVQQAAVGLDAHTRRSVAGLPATLNACDTHAHDRRRHQFLHGSAPRGASLRTSIDPRTGHCPRGTGTSACRACPARAADHGRRSRAGAEPPAGNPRWQRVAPEPTGATGGYRGVTVTGTVARMSNWPVVRQPPPVRQPAPGGRRRETLRNAGLP